MPKTERRSPGLLPVLAGLGILIFFALMLLRGETTRRTTATPRSGDNSRPSYPEGAKLQVKTPPGDVQDLRDARAANTLNPMPSRIELIKSLKWLGEVAFSNAKGSPETELMAQQVVQLATAQSRDLLLQILVGSDDPHVRWTLISLLWGTHSLEGESLTLNQNVIRGEISDLQLMEAVGAISKDRNADQKLRSLAIEAVLWCPPEFSGPVLLTLLNQAGNEPRILRALQFNERPISLEVHKLAIQKAGEVFSGPASEEEDRVTAVHILSRDPDITAQLVAGIHQERSAAVRRSIAIEGMTLLTKNANLTSPSALAAQLIGIAVTSEDVGVQGVIVTLLGSARIREFHGASACKALISLTKSGKDEQLRISAIRSLGKGGYVSAVNDLRALILDPMPRIALEAQAAIQRLEP